MLQCHWVLTDKERGVIDTIPNAQNYPHLYDILTVAKLLQHSISGEAPTFEQWEKAASNSFEWDMPSKKVAFAIANTMHFEEAYANDIPTHFDEVMQSVEHLLQLKEEYIKCLRAG